MTPYPSAPRLPALACLASGMGIVVTVITLVLWFKGLTTILASTAGAFTGMIPIAALISAAILVNEEVTGIHLAGLTVVLAGIILVARAPALPDMHRPPLLWRIRRSVPEQVS